MELRTGPALVRAASQYAVEDRARTWRLLVVTFLVLAAFETVALAAPLWPLRVVGSLFAGLTAVRLFIFFHDAMHGAIFRGSRLGSLIMNIVGLYLLNPPSVWRETHDYHHQNNAKLAGSSIGSFPVVTKRMWVMMKPRQRLAYRFARHPLTILFGYFTIFTGGMCVSAFRRNPRRHWHSLLALIVHYGTAVALGVGLSWEASLLGLVLPSFIAMAAGGYLFYAQHNFPDIDLRERRDWDYGYAALRSSSMFEMSPMMHWFTGNIGYHHVHHLHHRIPFYELPRVMAEMPELADPGRTSWHPRDVWRALRLAFWDPALGRMVSWGEVR